MRYEVKGLVPVRPTKKPLRAKHLKQGEIGVITEVGDNFGHHVLMVNEKDASRWLVCLNDATISNDLWGLVCRRLKPSEKVTLLVKEESDSCPSK